MKYLKKYKITLILTIAFLLAYFGSRLVNLTSLPIFTDEAIYLRWAQIAENDSNWRFISLTDGKQPLYIWITMVAMRFVQDPLVAGRLVSVFTGLIGAMSMYLLGKELFKRKLVGWLSVLFYLVSPYSLFYQRLALMDGLLTSLFLLTLYFEVLLVKKLRLDLALLLGMLMGAAMLTKTSGFLTLYLVPLSLFLFDFKAKNRINNFLKWLVLISISATLSQGFYAVLRLSPYFHIIAEKDTTFVYPFKEWLHHPFTYFIGNFTGLFDWLTHYMSWPVSLLIILALLFSLKKYFRERWYLFFWFALPFLALALFGKVLYPRYIAFMVMPLLIIGASTFLEISQKMRNIKYLIILALLTIIPLIMFDYQILFDITHAPLTPIDKGQYVNDWPSGWGVKETVAYLQKEAKKGPIAIYTDGTFGLMPYSVELYMVYDPNVKIVGLWPVPDIMPKEMEKSAQEKKTYFVSYQRVAAPVTWPVEELGRWQKGANDKSYLILYQIKNTSEDN